MTIKLIATDLDGTLFDDDKKVSQENRQALNAAREKGVHVVLTTGRPLRAITYLLEELNLMGGTNYSITINGGLVQKNDGAILAKTDLTWDEAKVIIDTILPLGLPLDILTDEVVYEINQPKASSLYKAVNPHLVFEEISDASQLPKNIVINKIISAYEPAILDDKLKTLPVSLKEQFEIFKSRDIVLEFMPKGVHKAVGLAYLCNHLGIAADEVLAIGDEENDLTMIEWAGVGVAMKNAVSALKERANVVTPNDNNHSGLAWAINNYVLGD